MFYQAISPTDISTGQKEELKITSALTRASRSLSVRQLQDRVKFSHGLLMTVLTRMYREGMLECFHPKFNRSEVKLKKPTIYREFCPLCNFPMRQSEVEKDVWICRECDLEFEMHDP